VYEVFLKSSFCDSETKTSQSIIWWDFVIVKWKIVVIPILKQVRSRQCMLNVCLLRFRIAIIFSWRLLLIRYTLVNMYRMDWMIPHCHQNKGISEIFAFDTPYKDKLRPKTLLELQMFESTWESKMGISML